MYVCIYIDYEEQLYREGDIYSDKEEDMYDEDYIEANYGYISLVGKLIYEENEGKSEEREKDNEEFKQSTKIDYYSSPKKRQPAITGKWKFSEMHPDTEENFYYARKEDDMNTVGLESLNGHYEGHFFYSEDKIPEEFTLTFTHTDGNVYSIMGIYIYIYIYNR